MKPRMMNSNLRYKDTNSNWENGIYQGGIFGGGEGGRSKDEKEGGRSIIDASHWIRSSKSENNHVHGDCIRKFKFMKKIMLILFCVIFCVVPVATAIPSFYYERLF